MAKSKGLHDNLKYDKRLLDINLKNGTLSKSEYDNFIQTLPDLQDQAVPLTLSEGSAASSPAETSMEPPAAMAGGDSGFGTPMPSDPMTSGTGMGEAPSTNDFTSTDGNNNDPTNPFGSNY